MKTLALANSKGGVGKTTSAVSLAAALAVSVGELVDESPTKRARGGDEWPRSKPLTGRRSWR